MCIKSRDSLAKHVSARRYKSEFISRMLIGNLQDLQAARCVKIMLSRSTTSKPLSCGNCYTYHSRGFAVLFLSENRDDRINIVIPSNYFFYCIQAVSAIRNTYFILQQKRTRNILLCCKQYVFNVTQKVYYSARSYYTR